MKPSPTLPPLSVPLSLTSHFSLLTSLFSIDAHSTFSPLKRTQHSPLKRTQRSLLKRSSRSPLNRSSRCPPLKQLLRGLLMLGRSLSCPDSGKGLNSSIEYQTLGSKLASFSQRKHRKRNEERVNIDRISNLPDHEERVNIDRISNLPDHEERVNIDRISNLSDQLLGDILSFLPSKDAVATSVLSRRWRHVFTLVRRLDFDDSPISYCYRNGRMINCFPLFVKFVDNVIQAFRSENLTSFTLHISKVNPNSCVGGITCTPVCFPELKPMLIESWVCFPLFRGVRELNINVHVRNPTKVPVPLFGCQTLELLKLNVNLHLETPSLVSLPNLRELHLCLDKYPQDNSVTMLVSSCPSLEHLAINGCWDPTDPVIIFSQSLRRLVIGIYDVYGYERTKLLLNVPNLEHLVYTDTFASFYSIAHMNALVEATVDAQAYFETMESHLQAISSFVSSMSNVQCLFLTKRCVQAFDDCEAQLMLPVFHNLKNLHLGCSEYHNHKWNKIMMKVLNCAPILETLTFPQGSAGHTYMDVAKLECQLWISIKTIPSCLMSHLKKIVIKEYQNTKWELEMVKYFMRNSLVLEEFIVVCKTSETSAGAEKISLVNNELQKLPRGSTTCSVIVR